MSGERDDRRLPARPLLVALLLAALFGLAELPFATFMADDIMQLAALEGRVPYPALAPWQLSTLADRVPEHARVMQNAGAFPWFFDPHFRMAFFRPLSSTLLAADHALWGLQPLGYRLQGIAWFLLLVLGLGLVLRRALPGAVGALALIVFVMSGIQGSLFWNATRHIVVAAALGTLALAAHICWRETGWRPGRVLAIAGFALAFTAGEAALAVVLYLVAYETLGAPGRVDERGRAALPVLLIVAVYLAVYPLLGLGVGQDAGYTDPLHAPLEFLINLPARWLFLVGALINGGGADLWLLAPDLRWLMLVVAAAWVGAFAWALRETWPGAPADERRGARWLIVGAALSAIPFVGAPLGSRCLVVPLLGGSVGIAFVLHRWWTVRGRQPATYGRAVAVICTVFAVVHLVLAPITRLMTPYAMGEMLHHRVATVMEAADLDAERLPGQRVVVLRAPDFIIGLHAYFYRALYRLPMPRSWRTLVWSPRPQRMTRVATDAFELELADGGVRASRLAVGDVVDLDGMRATVLARGTRGPTRVRFQFDRSLDDADLVLLNWRDDRLQRFVPPPVGESATP